MLAVPFIKLFNIFWLNVYDVSSFLAYRPNFALSPYSHLSMLKVFGAVQEMVAGKGSVYSSFVLTFFS